MVLNIAHRGGAGLWPENTLGAFSRAIAMGADGAELDVQLSRDGEVVVFHDYRLKPEICRGPDGRWLTRPTPLIKDLTVAELKRYDVGRPDGGKGYGTRYPNLTPIDGERIPTLAEVLSVCAIAKKPFHLFVELKTSWADRSVSAGPEELVEATVEVLRRANYLDRTVFVGFDWPGLLHAGKIAPGVKRWFTTLAQSWFRDTPPPPEDEPPAEAALNMLRHLAKTGTSPWAGGFDAVNYGGSILKAIKAAGGDGWFPMYRDATPAMVKDAQELGLEVGAWTVDEPNEMKTLVNLGLTGICTDRPDLLSDVLRR